MHFIAETGYGGQSHRRTWPKQRRNPPDHNSSTAYNNKDDDLVNKIRFYQEIMNKRAKRPFAGDASKHGTRYDFNAWYDAHYNNRYEKDGEPIPDHGEDIREASSKDPYRLNNRVPPGYPQGNVYKLRPSRPQAWRPPTNVERQLEKEQEVEKRRYLLRVSLVFVTIFGLSGYFLFDSSVPLHRPPSINDRSEDD